MRTIKDILKEMPNDIPVTIVTNKQVIATLNVSAWLNRSNGYPDHISDVLFNDITETYCRAKGASPTNITIDSTRGCIRISNNAFNAYIVNSFKKDIGNVVDGILNMPANRIYMLLINNKNVDTGGEGMIIDTTELPILCSYELDDLPETSSTKVFDIFAKGFVERNPNMFTGYFDVLNKEASK